MVCRKRSCYDTRNCFIDSLASRLHILQFVTWPISIFQADVDKNPSAPHTRLHFVMTRRMHGGRGRGPEGQPPSSSSLSPAIFLLFLHGERRWWKGVTFCPAFPPGFTGLGPHDVSGSAVPSVPTREPLVVRVAWTRRCGDKGRAWPLSGETQRTQPEVTR